MLDFPKSLYIMNLEEKIQMQETFGSAWCNLRVLMKNVKLYCLNLEAEWCMRILYDINSPYFTKLYGLKKDQDGKWLVFIERVSVLYTWMVNVHEDMWKFCCRKCVGIEFKRKLFWG